MASWLNGESGPRAVAEQQGKPTRTFGHGYPVLVRLWLRSVLKMEGGTTFKKGESTETIKEMVSPILISIIG